MRKSMIRTGAEVMDKVTGKELVVSSVEDGVGIAYPKDEDPEESNRRLITEENCICFRFLRNPIKTIGIDAKIDDGAFIVNGVALETGSIKPAAILGTVPGKVVLTAQGKEEGKVDLMVYNVDRDRFSVVGRNFAPENILVHTVSDNAIAVLKTETITEPDEDGVAVEVGTDDVLYLINEARYEASAECELCEILDIAVVKNGDDEDLYFLCKSHAIAGKKPFSEVWVYVAAANELMPTMDLDTVADSLSVGPQGIAVFAGDTIAVKYIGTDYKVSADGLAKKVDPEGKMVLVDVTSKGDTLTITFADPETYETVTVQSKRTRDRGDIVTVL